jgi:ribosomal protein L34
MDWNGGATPDMAAVVFSGFRKRVKQRGWKQRSDTEQGQIFVLWRRRKTEGNESSGAREEEQLGLQARAPGGFYMQKCWSVSVPSSG